MGRAAGDNSLSIQQQTAGSPPSICHRHDFAGGRITIKFTGDDGKIHTGGIYDPKAKLVQIVSSGTMYRGFVAIHLEVIRRWIKLGLKILYVLGTKSNDENQLWVAWDLEEAIERGVERTTIDSKGITHPRLEI